MRFSIIAAAALLASCGSSGIESQAFMACQEFTKAALAAPSTYSLVDTSSWDEPLTGAEMEDLRKLHPSIGHETPGLRYVGIEFEAENVDGTIIRSVNVCPFATSDGDILDEEIAGTKRLAIALRGLANEAAAETEFPEMKRPVPTT